ncbi:MAG: EAL domain-containing protein [Gammaproteobacteria bacterium]|nr:EAL domain-containing protein [Gammaproteobacteria bacterium]
MGDTSTLRRDAIRHTQNALLYSGVKFSAVGSLAAAVVLVTTFHEIVNTHLSYVWMFLVCSIYFARIADSFLFAKDQQAENRTDYWSSRFYWGAMFSSAAWASSIWLMFPADYPAYQVLLVLTIGAVAGGALASLPYDNKLSLTFQCLLFFSVEVKLLTFGSSFSYEVALYSAFVFGFLISCGAKVGVNYLELLRLKQDSQDTNLAVIKATEQMAQMGYWQWEESDEHVTLSENLSRLLGFDRKTVTFHDCLAKIYPDDRHILRNSLRSVMEGAEHAEAAIEYRLGIAGDTDFRYIRQLTRRMSDSEGKMCLFGSVQDISAIKTAEDKIYNMAYYDSLTQLSNRAQFHEHLENYTLLAKKNNQKYSIIYMDLDNFKGVNDSYGHETGDGYLSVFADYLRSIVSRTDLISRLGGDEFCILLHDITGDQEVNIIAQRCLEFSDQPIEIGNHRIHPKLSIGISIFPEHGQQPDEIVKSADLAMYHVKQHGKQNIAVYNESMEKDSTERVRLEADLRKALADDDFELWYQPKYDIRTNTIAGAEALIRWRHPVKGLIPPDLFITTAERVGVIKDIGEWVLASACTQLKQWNELGYRIQMAVNISGDHFASSGFSDHVKQTVLNKGIHPEDLEVEITESLSRDPLAHTRICHDLRSAGIRVAIDDFGTGYSSLSVLGELEVDTLKIDRSFIQHLPEDKASKLMVKTITDLALGLGYECVAEGVETQAQLDFLRALNCPYVQGYFFSKPILAEDMLELLSQDQQTTNVA